MNWVTQNWIWLVLLGGVAFFLLFRSGRRNDARAHEDLHAGHATGATSKGTEADRHGHHGHGC